MTLMTHDSLQRATEHYRRTWGVEPSVLASSPGRVNLIGEHTDYNDGFVLPMAINLRTAVALGPSGHNSGLHLASAEKPGVESVNGPPWEPAADTWTNYVVGVMALLTRHHDGIEHGSMGLNIAVASDVPMGSGLSSSAALEAAAATALLAYFRREMAPAEVAKLCQATEHEFAGVRCGIMDQMSSIAGHVLLLDCRTLETKTVRLPAGVQVVILDSGIPRGLSSSAYNERRSQCEEGVDRMKARYPEITALRDVSTEMLENSRDVLSDVVFRRCRHVVTENQRVLDAADCLRTGDVVSFGRLMVESHASMRDDYEISLPEMDSLVEIARGQPGCYGARLTGAGFGGACVALVDAEAGAGFGASVLKEYARVTGREGDDLCVTAEPGARVDTIG